MNYENQIEGEPQPGALAPTGDWEIIRQFQLLCTFGLKAAFDLDRTSIELNCREKRKHSGDQYLPSRFTTRFFNPVIQGNNNEVLEKNYLNLIKECHIELMVTGLIFSPTLSWKLSECIETYESYFKNKFNKNTLYIPRLIEVFLIVEIANMALKEKQVDIYKTWLNNACLEASGIPAIQNAIKNLMNQTEEIQLDNLLKLLK